MFERKVMEDINRTLQEIARRATESEKERFKQIPWVPKENEFKVWEKPSDLFEVSLPPEYTSDTDVTKETIRIIPQRDHIQISITDASLPPSKCEEIAIKFSKLLYEKATGKRISSDQILVKNIAGLPVNICEHCLQEIEGLPYVCRVCGRTFCYQHRKPETHGCQVQTKVRVDLQIPRKRKTSEHKPRVVIRKIPCG
jgi:hypothetical protein